MKGIYRLDSFENNKFNPIRDLSKQEFLEIKEWIAMVTLYKRHFLMYQYFELNLTEFDKLVREISDINPRDIDINKLQSWAFNITVNRIVINLLASFKIYIDSTEAFLKRKFNKESNEVKKWTELRKRLPIWLSRCVGITPKAIARSTCALISLSTSARLAF